MGSSANLSFNPVKLGSLTISPSDTREGEGVYKSRVVSSGKVTTVLNDYEIFSSGVTLSDDSPAVDGALTRPPFTNAIGGGKNPLKLTYTVRFLLSDDTYVYRSLTKAENYTHNDVPGIKIILSTSVDLRGREGSIAENDSWSILRPIDDGIRYLSDIADITDNLKTITSSINTLPQDTLGLSSDTYNKSTDFEIVFFNSNGKFRIYDLLSVTNSGANIEAGLVGSSTIVNIREPLDPIFLSSTSPPSVFSDVRFLIRPKPSIWKSFCNPSYLASGEFHGEDGYFTESDLIANHIEDGTFDYDIDEKTGAIYWYGNTIFGSSRIVFFDRANATDEPEYASDPNMFSSVVPTMPFDSRMKYSLGLKGSTSFLSRNDAFTLTNKGDASSLHHHNSLYPEIDTVLLKDQSVSKEDSYPKGEIDKKFYELVDDLNNFATDEDVDGYIEKTLFGRPLEPDSYSKKYVTDIFGNLNIPQSRVLDLPKHDNPLAVELYKRLIYFYPWSAFMTGANATASAILSYANNLTKDMEVPDGQRMLVYGFDGSIVPVKSQYTVSRTDTNVFGMNHKQKEETLYKTIYYARWESRVHCLRRAYGSWIMSSCGPLNWKKWEILSNE